MRSLIISDDSTGPQTEISHRAPIRCAPRPTNAPPHLNRYDRGAREGETVRDGLAGRRGSEARIRRTMGRAVLSVCAVLVAAYACLGKGAPQASPTTSGSSSSSNRSRPRATASVPNWVGSDPLSRHLHRSGSGRPASRDGHRRARWKTRALPGLGGPQRPWARRHAGIGWEDASPDESAPLGAQARHYRGLRGARGGRGEVAGQPRQQPRPAGTRQHVACRLERIG